MSHDMTFCVTHSCPYRFTCQRFKDNNVFAENELISQCEFPHTSTKCDYYIKKKGE